MSNHKSELAKAREEVSFWQELAIHLRLPEPGIVQALDHAWERYDRAVQNCLAPRPLIPVRVPAKSRMAARAR